MEHNKPIIFLSGGGTLGSVTPLLALAEDLADCAVCHFVGTERGVERAVVESQGIIYHGIASGKLRRYFSLRNFIDPLFIVYGFFQSLFLIMKHGPKVMVSAGSFVSVSVAVAAKLLGVKIVILQLDILPGLANRLMARLATQIAVTLPESKADYPQAVLTGCPIRSEIRAAKELDKLAAASSFGFTSELPIILVLTGGTGSIAINKLVLDNLYNLAQLCQVIHVTGPAKRKEASKNKNYRSVELSTAAEMARAYAAADLVVSRAGMGVLTELAYLAKPVVLLPLPKSHQEANAQYFVERKAASSLDQTKTTAWTFVSAIKNMLADLSALRSSAHNLAKTMQSDSNQKFLNLIIKELDN